MKMMMNIMVNMMVSRDEVGNDVKDVSFVFLNRLSFGLRRKLQTWTV